MLAASCCWPSPPALGCAPCGPVNHCGGKTLADREHDAHRELVVLRRRRVIRVGDLLYLIQARCRYGAHGATSALRLTLQLPAGETWYSLAMSLT